jgi:hypothetical protein
MRTRALTVTGIAAPMKVSQPIARPGELTALYASYAALQAYEVTHRPPERLRQSVLPTETP